MHHPHVSTRTLPLPGSCAIVSLIAFILHLPATAQGAEPRMEREVEFARVDGQSLRLDLYLPTAAKSIQRPPLLIYVHGGAWRGGSRADVPIRSLVDRGHAIASIDYRLTTVARFPANVHDIKAAIRFLRASADRYGYDAGRFALVGSSAGGHLAALAGVTSDHARLEGTVGEHREHSSAVQAIVSYYGASNLESILDQSTDFGRGVRVPALRLLLGGLPQEQPELARLASPVAHVNAGDPPLMLIHGDADPQMPPEQSSELHQAYLREGLSTTLVMIPGGKHGGPEFYDETRLAAVEAFLREAFGPAERPR